MRYDDNPKWVSPLGLTRYILSYASKWQFSANLMTIRLSLLLILLLSLFVTAPISAKEIAIIIDDMGNKETETAAFELPREVVFAILPHTPFSRDFSKMAELQNREVMLHMPMEALSGSTMGPGGIHSQMTRAIIQQNIASAHATVPNAIGMNNHMGSKLTQLTFPMQATMEYLSHNRMFFLDSRTTRFSRAEKIAHRNGVPTAHRHIFLDHITETKHIHFQFNRLKRQAAKSGFAIGIAHPHEVTLEYLQIALRKLKQEGFTLVTMGDSLQPVEQQWVWNQPGQLSK